MWRHENKAHRVYFFACPSAGVVKIGFAIDPDKRFRDVQAMSPVDLVMLGHISANAEMERKLHTFFFDHHFRNEWFHLNGIVAAHIEALIDGTFDRDRLPAIGKRTWALVHRAKLAAARNNMVPTADHHNAERAA